MIDGSLLDVRGLRIFKGVGPDRRPIVDGVDIHVRAGETVGIVGESGSGKSLTARALVNLLPAGIHAEGVVEFGQRNLLTLPERQLSKVRGTSISLVFQDPFTMLNPLRTCGDHVVETVRGDNGRRLKGARRDAEAHRRLTEVGIRDEAVASRYPFELSGGMRQRVGIASALAQDPALLIADEPSTALDVTTQRAILALLRSLQKERGMGLVLITHDLRVAFAMCDRIYVLYAGSVLEVGAAQDIAREPLHPYTLALLISEPPVDRRLTSLVAIPGGVPTADAVENRCAFAGRCVWVESQCESERPALRAVEPNRESRCIRIEAIRETARATREAATRGASTHLEFASTDELVRVSDLTKAFIVRRSGGDAGQVQALAGVSIAIATGESVGLVGESGSGKSTLARCLLGLEKPTSGTISIDNIRADDFASMAKPDLRHVRRTIQIVFQDPYATLNPMRTVGSTLTEALRVAGTSVEDIKQARDELLASVGLPASYAARKPVALSGGERQRVAIARALAVRPQILVCDEPVSSLDVSVQAQILNLFKELRTRSKMAYLFITHDLAVVRQVADRVYVMHRGVVVEDGLVDDVLDRPQHPYTAALIASLPQSSPEWLEEAG
jgi:peptide/nickel transport system ATP-binding protein